MDYELIKARYLRMYRLMDLNDFSGGVIAHNPPTRKAQKELDQLIDQCGLDHADLDAYDATADQLCGCQDIAPACIQSNYHLEANATYHDVWREWITHKLLDCPDDKHYAYDLYKAYARDLAVLAPEQPASKLGFRDWMEAQTWDMVFMIDVLNQIIDDPVELPA